MSEHVYKRDDDVIWEESRTWGGKQNNPAKFVRYAGDKSARIRVDGKERTVRLVWLRPRDEGETMTTAKSDSSTGEQETGELKPCGICSFHWKQIVMPGETHNRNCPHYYDEEKGCACQLCGNRFKVDVNVSDDLWQQVSGSKEMVCGLCVLRAVEKLDEFASYDLIDTDAR